MILTEPVLVGRQRQLEELYSSLCSIERGEGSTVFISGEAGSGKTRLTAEFLNQTKQKGITVLSGWCLSHSVVPYFPFVEAFESYLPSRQNGKPVGLQQLNANTWLVKSESTQTETPQVWKDQAYSSITKELLFLSTEKPLILFIDDLHWADSASLSLLHYIARSIACERIMILATFRSEEQERQLVETLRLMGREALFTEIKLPRLNKQNVGEIAESMLGGKANVSFIDRLASESRGVPLYVVESVRMLYEEKNLLQKDGEWRLSSKKFNIPAKVKDVILRRVDSLKPTHRRVLDAASVVGEKFDPKLVAAIISQDSLDVLDALNTIAQDTLLVHCEGNSYRFDHAKSREMLYGQISPPLKKEYHLRIAEKMESQILARKTFPAGDLAFHFARAGDKEKAVKYALAAGRDALIRFSNNEALTHFSYILQNLGEESENADVRALATEGLGEAFFAISAFKEAIRTFEKLSDFAVGVAKIRALRRAMDSAFFQGDFAHLLDLTKKTEGFTTFDRLESARILMNKARAVMFLGNQEAGRKDFKAALRIFEEECSLPDAARTLLGMGGADPEEQKESGLARALWAVALFEELGDIRGLMDACHRAGQSFGACFLRKEAVNMEARAISIGKRIGDFNRVAEAYASKSCSFEARGDFSSALSLSLMALDYSGKTDSDWIRGITYSNLVRQYTWLGDLEKAEEYLGKLKELPLRVLSSPLFVRFALSKAVYSANVNLWDEANQSMKNAFAMFERRLNPAEEAFHRISYARILRRQKREEEAKTELEKRRVIIDRFTGYFEHAILQAPLLVPREVKFGQDFALRIYLVNVSRKPCALSRIEGVVPATFRIEAMPEYCTLEDDILVLKENSIGPFQVKRIRLELSSEKPGNFTINPRIIYFDDLGQTQKLETVQVPITVKPISLPTKVEGARETGPSKLEFKSEAAQRALDYLVKAFVEDYVRLKLPQERSGWRTLMNIAKQGNISKHSVYCSSGGRGIAVTELERRGLAEARMFIGERGRGGRIIKIRIAYENEIVRRRIDLQAK